MVWRWRAVRRMEREIVRLEHELAMERKINETLRHSLVLAVDPKNYSAERVEEMTAKAATDPDAVVVQMPDGEYVAPAAYNWERLAWDIYDTTIGDDDA